MERIKEKPPFCHTGGFLFGDRLVFCVAQQLQSLLLYQLTYEADEALK